MGEVGYIHYRGVVLLRGEDGDGRGGRGRVVVQDEVFFEGGPSGAEGLGAGKNSSGGLEGLGVIWRMFTASTVRVLSPRRAELRIGDKILGAEIAAGMGSFVVVGGGPGELGPWEGSWGFDDEDEVDEEGEGGEGEEGSEEEDEGGKWENDVDESMLSEKERKKLQQKRERRTARQAEKKREREAWRAAKGKADKSRGEKGRDGGGDRSKILRREGRSVFRRGVDRSKVKEDVNEGVSCLCVVAALGGRTWQLSVVLTPGGVGEGDGGVKEGYPSITTWAGRL